MAANNRSHPPRTASLRHRPATQEEYLRGLGLAYLDAGVAVSSPSRTRASAPRVDLGSVARLDQIFAASSFLPADVSARAASARYRSLAIFAEARLAAA